MTPAVALQIIESFLQGNVTLPLAQEAVADIVSSVAPALSPDDDANTANMKMWLRHQLATLAGEAYQRDAALYFKRADPSPPPVPPGPQVQRALRIVRNPT